MSNSIKRNFPRIFSILIILILAQCSKDDQTITAPVVDIDGNVYNTILIGNQIWMKENLITTKFSNGDPIYTTDPIDEDIYGEIHPVYQWFYFEEKDNPSLYGRFYTWYAISDNRNVCPDGWHVPTSDEWKEMISYLGGSDIAGGKLKETDIEYWGDPNVGASNSTGFSAIATNYRTQDGSLFILLSESANFWTIDEADFIDYTGPEKRFGIHYTLMSNTDNIYGQMSNKENGMSCRCIKDN